MAEIKFEIKETIGVLSESTKGWTKELNLISWNDAAPKYDIREWSPLVLLQKSLKLKFILYQ